MHDCLSLGILVVDHLCDPIPREPAPGELVVVERLPLSIGGCAANVAVDLTRLGVRVQTLGCVGRDPLGQFLIDSLKAAGAGVDGILQIEAAETSSTLIINVQGQDRRFIHAAGASAHVRAARVPLEKVLAAKVFYVGGYLLMANLEPEGLAALFRQARRAGVITVLDIVLPGEGDHWPRLAPVLAETDVFLPNHDEARVLTGEDDALAQALRFRAAGARTVVITQGGAGSLLLSDEGSRLRAGVYPTQYRGGTGSGDAFDAGYIAGLLAGESPSGCLRWASAAGASCVRSVSATESVFTRDEAIAFMREHSLTIETLPPAAGGSRQTGP